MHTKLIFLLLVLISCNSFSNEYVIKDNNWNKKAEIKNGVIYDNNWNKIGTIDEKGNIKDNNYNRKLKIEKRK